MNDIRDKAFDQLIKDKLDGFVPEVPTTIWDRIHAGLEEQDQKTLPNVVPLYPKKSKWWANWSYAAAVAVFLGVGITLIRQPNEVIYLSAHEQHQEIKEDKKAVLVGAQQALQDERKNHQPLSYQTTNSNKLAKSNMLSSAKETDVIPVALEVVDELETHDDLASVQSNYNIAPKVQSEEVLLTIEPLIVEENAVTYGAVSNMAVLVVDESEPTDADKSRFGVSNVLNYVVGVVDKNEEKILAFKHDDEGSISLALNMKALKKRRQSYIN